MAKPQEQDFPPAFTSSSLTAGPRSGSWREKPTPFPRRWGLLPAAPFRGSMKPAVLGDCLRLCLSATGGLWGTEAAQDQEREAPECRGCGGEAGPSGALSLFMSLVTGGCKGILVCPPRGPGALSPTVAGGALRGLRRHPPPVHSSPSTYKSLREPRAQWEGDGGPQQGRLWSRPSFIFLELFHHRSPGFDGLIANIECFNTLFVKPKKLRSKFASENVNRNNYGREHSL